MSDRLISADALLKDITHRYCENCDRRKGMKNGVMKTIYEIGEAPCRACGIGDMRDELDDAPTVDAELVKHGHWIGKSQTKFEKLLRSSRVVKCSVCGNYLELDGVNFGRGSANFCPNCGAKMDEVKDE